MSQTAPPPLPTRETTAIGKHPCPECGGNLEWNAAKQALACPYCGTIATWQPAEAASGDGRPVDEHDLDAALRDPANQRGWSEERREVQCQSCRAISVFVDGRVAQRCDFCGSPAIVAHESLGDAITPQSLLPFKLSEGQVRDRIRAWYGGRWFAPNRLKTAALTDTLKGVYLPYWTFDAHANAHWQAEAGHYYYTTETYRDSNGNTQTRQVQHVRWEPASGSLQHFFDDDLVPGTVGLHAALLRQIDHPLHIFLNLRLLLVFCHQRFDLACGFRHLVDRIDHRFIVFGDGKVALRAGNIQIGVKTAAVKDRQR